MSFSSKTGFEFTEESSFRFSKSEIANTGLTLFFTGAKLDLSRTSNIPEATADGRPDDFVGVFIQEATIGLPTWWKKDDAAGSTAEIYGQNLIIGTGGISGKIGMRPVIPGDPNPVLLSTKFGGDSGLSIALKSFDITFQQNTIIGSNIEGTLTIPGFNDKETGQPARIGVTIAIQNGEFVVTAKAIDEPLTITIPGVMDLEIKTLTVGKKDDRYFIGITGQMDLSQLSLGPVNNLFSDKIELKKLIIWSDGQLEFAGGGSFNLKKPITLKFKPVTLSITAIHLGAFERYHGTKDGQPWLRKYKYIGFDGSINVNPGGVDAKGSGIKIYFTTDGGPLDVFIRIQSIAIDLTISGSDPSVQIKGLLATSDPEGDEYTGAVSFKLKKPGVSGSATMRLDPKVPRFLIDIGLELPTPILLGSTGLGIYAFRALLGQRYVATKKAAGIPDDGRWYDYYKAKVAPEYEVGVKSGKFEGKKGFSLGAGVALSTAADSGKALSAKIFLLLSIPEVIILQGQAAILKGRLGLDDPKDPPFGLFLAISKESFQLTAWADYLIPDDSGAILDAHAEFDMAFFFGDSSAWYINLGTESNPNKAEVLRLFKMYSFLMLSARGIKMGGGIEYNFQKNIGPFGIKAYAYLKFGAFLNFKPTQVGGFFAIGGGLEIRFLFFSLGLSFSIGLAGEAPHPFIVTGTLHACISIKLFFKKKEKCVELDLTWEFDRTQIKDPVIFLKGDGTDAKAINILTEEPFPVLSQAIGNAIVPGAINDGAHTYNGIAIPPIPVDSFINIEFDKPVKQGPALNGIIGGNVIDGDYIEFSPPQRGKYPRVQHSYSVDNVRVYSWNPVTGSWQPYNIYEALTPIQYNEGLFTTDVRQLPVGYWQIDNPNRKNKLSILARTPVNFLRYGTPPPMEELGITVDKLFCPGKRREKKCIDFLSYSLNSIFGKDRLTALRNGVKMNVSGSDGKVLTIPNVFSFDRSLFITDDSTVELLLPEPSAQVYLMLAAITMDVQVGYYSRSSSGAYTLVKQETFSRNQLVTEITYDNGLAPVDRILIEPGECPPQTALSCGELLPQAAQLLTALNSMAQAHTLAQGDPDNGAALTLSKPVPAQYLPQGSQSGTLDLHVVSLNNQWRLSNIRPLHPGGPRTVVFRVERSNAVPVDLTLQLPAFNIHIPALERQLVISQFYNFLQANAPYLTLTERTTDSFRIIGDSTVVNISFVLNTAFSAILAPDSGRTFNYNNIASFSNLRQDPDSRVEGVNYNFLVTANITGGGSVELAGSTTSFPIVCCGGITAQYAASMCTAITSQIAALQTQLTEVTQQITQYQILCDTLGGDDACAHEGQRYCAMVPQLQQVRTQIQSQITTLTQFQSVYCGTGGGGQGNFCSSGFPASACGAYLFQMCYMTEVDFQYNATVPDMDGISNSTNAMVEAIEKPIQPLWRPSTTFGIVLSITDTVGAEDEAKVPYTTNFAYVFRTEGPTGHFMTELFTSPDNSDPEKEKKRDEFKLADLRHYVDYGKSYPNADGSIVNAKPLYTLNPKLLLFFVVDYMYTMYGIFAPYNGLPGITKPENLLEVVIRDPARETAITLPDGSTKFATDPYPVIPADIQTMINMLRANNPCLSIQVSDPKGVHQETVLPELEPLKLYTALFKSNYKGEIAEVLRYNFQTSRYRTFEDHINSYQLKNEKGEFMKNAVYDIKLRSLDFNLAVQVINNILPADHALISQFMHPYDRLMDGVLKIQELAPAVNTEFNIIRDWSTGNPSSDYIIGILVRSPEPFNDPKIPLDILNTGIKVLKANGDADAAFDKVIISKDASNIFITRSDLHILDTTLTFRFNYYEFDGGTYTVKNNADVTLPTPSSLTQLTASDCGKTEVELNEVLQADLVKEAYEYEFLVEGPNGFSKSYLRSDADGKLPLTEITGLDYNKTYTVKVKNRIPDGDTNRQSAFGPACTIATRKLNFVIQPLNSSYAYTGVPTPVAVKLQFLDGTVYSRFNGKVTLQSTGAVTGKGEIDILNGVGSLNIQDAAVENVTLSLTDSAGTGYGVAGTAPLAFVEHADRLVINPVPANVAPNVPVKITVRATGPAGVTDPGYNGTVTLNASSSTVYGKGQLNIVNGIGEINIGDTKSEKVTLSLANPSTTSLNVGNTTQVKFVRPGVTFVIETNSNATANTDVTVTIKAKVGNTVDTNFNLGVTLNASGSDSGGGLVAVSAGVGTAVIKRAAAGNVTLTLTDTEGTGANVSSTATIHFA